MKDIPEDIKQKVLEGFVLDEKGNWISINDKVERERSFMMHLEAGEVLCDGKWMKIADAKNRVKEMEEKKENEDPFLAVGTYTELEETKDMLKTNISSVPTMIPSNPNTVPPPPSTKFGFPVIEAEEETKYLEIKRSTVDHYRNSHREPENNEELEETMSFDMKSIIGSHEKYTSLSNNKPGKKLHEISSVTDSWDKERKRKQLIFFSISFTVALFAILGALALAFLM